MGRGLRAASLGGALLVASCGSERGEPVVAPIVEGGSEAFEVVDDESYQQLLDAGTAAEILRSELSADSRPRIAASAALLWAFAERNTGASAGQLQAYVGAVEGALARAYPPDEYLRRPAHLLPALRFASETAMAPELVGRDVRVGDDGLVLLELNLDSSTRSLRAVDFARAQSTDFAYHSPLSRIVTWLMLDRVPSGRHVPGLADAMRTLARINGLELEPEDLEASFPEIARARASMPPDFAAFEAERATAFAPRRLAVGETFEAVRARIDALNARIKDTLTRKPDPLAATTEVADPVLMENLRQLEEQGLRERAQSRATLSLSALLMEQSEPDHEYGRQVRGFADAQLRTEDTLQGLGTRLELGGLSLRTLGRFATGDALGGVGGLLLTAKAIFDASHSQAPSADQQIFDQMVGLRTQVEALRQEMRERFDHIESQLNVIYDAMTSGLNQLNQTTRRIDANVQQLSVDLYELRSSLTSLEANLYGVLSAGFEQSFVEDMETGLDYRRRTGSDLQFTGAGENTFFGFHSRFFARATVAATDEVYAGPAVSSLANDAAAAQVLSDFPLGYNINNLRQFPAALGVPPWSFGRVANPTTWSLAADAYAQLARENPWYFAKLNKNDPGRLEALVGEGTSVREMMRGARSRALIQALADGYLARAKALDERLGVPAFLASRSIPLGLDPFGGLSQDLQDAGAAFSEIFLANVADAREEMWFDGSLPWEFVDPRLGLISGTGDSVWPPSRWELSYLNLITNAAAPEPQYRFVLRVLDEAANAYEEETVWYDFADTPPSNYQQWMRENGAAVAKLFRSSVEGEQSTTGEHTLVFRRREHRQVGDMPVPTEAEALAALQRVADDYWLEATNLLNGSDVASLLGSLQASQALLRAYVSLGLPETMDGNDVVHGLLRGAASAESGLSGSWIAGAFEDARAANAPPPEFFVDLEPRVDVLLEQLGPALDSEYHEAHPYLEWSLAGLRDLQAHALSLSVDDSYAVPLNTTLAAGADDGVLANDAEQPGVVSLSVALVSPPSHGSLTLSADGAFTYSPDRGFVGQDTFSYEVSAQVAVDEPEADRVTSAAATVVLSVE